MTTIPVPGSRTAPPSSLPASWFQILSEVAPELKWFTNLPNPDPGRAYRQNIQDLMAFAGLHQSEQFWEITRAVITWREEITRQELAHDTIHCKLVALSSALGHKADISTTLMCGKRQSCPEDSQTF